MEKTVSTAQTIAYEVIDAAQYAVVVVGAVVVVAGTASYLLTGALVGLKWLLFLVGTLLMGAGAVKLRPAPAWREEPRRAFANGYTEDGVGGVVNRLPPVAWLGLAPGERCSDGGRLFWAGVLAWVVSIGLEAVFGVGVPTVA